MVQGMLRIVLGHVSVAAVEWRYANPFGGRTDEMRVAMKDVIALLQTDRAELLDRVASGMSLKYIDSWCAG